MTTDGMTTVDSPPIIVSRFGNRVIAWPLPRLLEVLAELRRERWLKVLAELRHELHTQQQLIAEAERFITRGSQ
jgi:hypothetical protein